jgi:cell division protein FtsB
MTEHETFKAMCDRIWYDISKNLWYLWFQYHEWNLYKFLW